MGVQGLRKFIAALSCTKTIYPQQKRSRSAPANLNGSDHSPQGTDYSNNKMNQRVAEQVANIFNRQHQQHTSNEPQGKSKEKPSNNKDETTPDTGKPNQGNDRLPAAHHVLFDLNSLIHSCFGKLEGARNTPQDTIEAVKARMEEILTTIITPTKTLSICLDGPAPLAKVRTQRLRRRRVSAINMAHNRQFSELSITAGSAFMVKLEREVATFLQSKYNDLFSMNNSAHGTSNKNDKRLAIYINGSTSPGEGESKISQMLGFHAYNPHTPYNPNDTVVIIGNDIDLTLTAMGSMYYHNTYILSPSSLQAFCVGDIMYRWLCPGSGFLQDAHYLPSARADLIFLFSLNGGDHFPGVGEAAADLWRRYKLLRSTNPARMIVSENLLTIDTAFLGDIFQINEYDGQADPSVGLLLLKASLWSTFTIITGVCPDYRFTVPDTILPSVSNIKAALAANKHNRYAVSIKYNPNATPLTPLATYTALMPTQEMYPDGALKALQTLPATTKINVRTLVPSDPYQRSYFAGNSAEGGGVDSGGMQYRLIPVNVTMETIRKQLQNVNDTHMVIAGVEGLIKAAEEHGLLSPAEAARNTFTRPVLITAPSTERMKRIADLKKDIAKGRLPENIKRKKESELQELMAAGPTFEIKPIQVVGSGVDNQQSQDAEGYNSGGKRTIGPSLGIGENYYSTIKEMLFTNIFNYSIDASFEQFEEDDAAVVDEDGLEISAEAALVAKEMNSFEGLLKKHQTAGSSKTAGSHAKAAAPTTTITNNKVRRIPVIQEVPEHLRRVRAEAVRIQNKDQMQRNFTSMLKGKRDRDVPDDDDRRPRREGTLGDKRPPRAEQQHHTKKGSSRMMNDDDYDEEAMADLDIDDDEDTSRPQKTPKGKKKSKKGRGFSGADLSDDEGDDGYGTAFGADDDDDMMGDDLDDGFGSASKAKKKVSKKTRK